MIIELMDRSYWLAEIDRRLQCIEEVRRVADAAYVKRWRHRRLLPDRGEDEFPEEDWYKNYPCESYGCSKGFMERLKVVLLNQCIGAINIDDEEYSYLTKEIT
jgi:hypothetical protein